MKKIFLLITILACISLASCADSYVEGHLIVKRVEKSNWHNPPYKYYVTFDKPNQGQVGLLTNTNYMVGDTLK